MALEREREMGGFHAFLGQVFGFKPLPKLHFFSIDQDGLRPLTSMM